MFAAPAAPWCRPPRRWCCCCFVGYDVRYQCTDCGSISALMFETFHNIALRGQSWFGAILVLASVEDLMSRAEVMVVSTDADVRLGGGVPLLLCSARSVPLGVT